jgi:pumilio family protein 6
MPGLQSGSKKRPAVSQGGPKSKKQHSDLRSKFEDEKLQKRSRPVTQPIQGSGLSDDEDEDEDDEGDEGEAINQEIDTDKMIVDTAASKDPNGMSMITRSKCTILITEQL